MTSLETAVRLAKKDRSAKGRTRYSDELKSAIRDAAKSNSKSKIAKETKISYPTVLKIVGTRKRARKSARPAAAKNGALSMAITVKLPSKATLQYTDIAQRQGRRQGAEQSRRPALGTSLPPRSAALGSAARHETTYEPSLLRDDGSAILWVFAATASPGSWREREALGHGPPGAGRTDIVGLLHE